jgi:hypothetical protein
MRRSSNRLTRLHPLRQTGIGESTYYISGSFTTTGGPITFDLGITATNGNIQGQNLAFGVTGGSAGLGVDNNIDGSTLESMTFTISNFSGLGVNETLEITGIRTLFGITGETYRINGGGNVGFTATVDSIPELINVTGTGTTLIFGAGTGGDTRFGIDAIQVSVVAIPEPSSFALIMLGLGGLCLLRRRS